MRVTVETAAGTFEVEDEFETLKENLFPVLRSVGFFDWSSKSWKVKYLIEGDAKRLLEFYGVPVERHNVSLREIYARRVKGTEKIYPLRRLNDYEFRKLASLADWNSGEKCFVVNPKKLASVGTVNARELLSKLPVVYDPDSIFGNAIARVEGNGIVVEGSPASLAEILRELAYIPYYVQEIDATGSEAEVVLRETRLAILRQDGVRLVGPLGAYAPLRAGRKCRVSDPPWEFPELEFPKKDFELRDYQEEAYRRWAENGGFGTVVIPTGGGKTYIALRAIAEIKRPTLVCVTTIELARQWKTFIESKLGVKAGLLGEGTSEIEPITVAIYNSAVRHLDEIKRRFYLHIYDEGHHVAANTFKEIALKSFSAMRLVLSATPERYDNNHALIYALAGRPVYKVTYTELVSRGFVAPLVYKRVSGFLSSREQSEYDRIEETEDYDKFGKLRGISGKKEIAFTASWKYQELSRILEEHKDRKILVFTERLDQARKAHQVAVKLFGSAAALITGETNDGSRKKTFEDFKRGDVRCIVTTRVLDEGVDVPDADVAIIMSNSGQARQMIQRIGRVVRPAKGKVAYIYDLITADTVEEALWKKRFEEASQIFQFSLQF